MPTIQEKEEAVPATGLPYEPLTVNKPSTNPRKDLLAQMQLPPSPAKSDIVMRQKSPRETSSATEREEQRLTRDIERGAPGDKSISSDAKTPERRELAKRKSQFFEDVFASREPIGSARERVTKESVVMADVRTNVIIQDEYTFITDLSYALSTRYQRPENSIIVTLTHSCCMLYGGNFDPAYILTITALPSQVQPVTNKRNATLLSKAMEEGLGVNPERGVIKFLSIPEENLASDGKTIAGEIEELEKISGEPNTSLQRSVSGRKNKRRQSKQSLRAKTGTLPTHNESVPPTPTLPPVLSQSTVSLDQVSTPVPPPIPTEKSALDRKAEKVQKVSRRKSFIATIFGKS